MGSGKQIRIYFDISDGEWHGGGEEGIWAEELAKTSTGFICRLLNSPFYFRGVSYMDIVQARSRTDGGAGLHFAGVVDRGGHSTYMILCPENSSAFESYWQRLAALGCTYEFAGLENTSFGPRDLYSVDVPESADVYQAYAVLEEGEEDDVWIFQEGYCGHPLKKPRN